jgi:hypothetical protein
MRSWDLDGIMWGSERQGAFANALGASHDAGDGRVTCFCDFCLSKAAAQGIRVERARSGFLALEKFVREGRSRARPVDGYYVELWRLMLTYPELLAWENFFHDSPRETYQAIYKKVKSLKPAMGVGWHIMHDNSFSPIYRAEQDLHRIAPYSDFLKIVMYHNCAGERMARYINNVAKAQYGDVPRNHLLELHYRVLGYGDEGAYDQISRTGLSNDYVLRETRRARAGLGDAKTLLLPGIDIDIRRAANHSKSTPRGTEDAVLAAFRGGADGLILWRKYSEMKLTNLEGAGLAIRQLGLAQ